VVGEHYPLVECFLEDLLDTPATADPCDVSDVDVHG
jgi:hypothetical protein